MTKAKKTVLKEYLNSCTKETLIADVAYLASKIDLIRDYYESKFNQGYSPQVAAKYKAIIENEFLPARGFGEGRLSVARKAVSDYGKVSDSKFGLADLMLHYVEIGVQYTTTFGDINEAFYTSMAGMYAKALNHIEQNDMQHAFAQRCSQIVADTSAMGWGFHDELAGLFVEYCSEESWTPDDD